MYTYPIYPSPQLPYGYNYCPCCGHKVNPTPPYIVTSGILSSSPTTLNVGERSEPSKKDSPILSPNDILASFIN